MIWAGVRPLPSNVAASGRNVHEARPSLTVLRPSPRLVMPQTALVTFKSRRKPTRQGPVASWTMDIDFTLNQNVSGLFYLDKFGW